jgi:hypothetical protein
MTQDTKLTVLRSDAPSDDGTTTSVGGIKRRSRTDSISTGFLDESLSSDLEASFASLGHFGDDDSVVDGSNPGYEEDCFESILEPLDGEDEDEAFAGEKARNGGRQGPYGMARTRSSDSCPSTRPTKQGAPHVVRANSDHCTRAVRRASSGRVVPRRGLSASCSGINIDAGLLNPGTPLSREKSKLCRLSSRSIPHVGLDGAPSRGVHRRTSARSVHSSSSEDSLDGNSSFAQLQLGDIVMLANKELSTSIHLKRQMPRGSTSRDVDATGSTRQLVARMNALQV